MSRFTLLTCLGAVASLASGAAGAALITDADSGLTLNTNPGVFYQQTKDDPCIIGAPDCKQPTGFGFTNTGSGGDGQNENAWSGGGTYNDGGVNEPGSPYTLAQVNNTLSPGSTSFIIGIDFNDTRVAQTLTSFSACYYSGLPTTPAGPNRISCQTFDIFTSLPTNNNGTGFTDFLLTGFTIAPNTSHIWFNAQWYNNDGPDSFFLIGSQDTPPVVSEPGTFALLGLGIGALGLLRRRRVRV